jgi:hypothetical protein
LKGVGQRPTPFKRRFFVDGCVAPTYEEALVELSCFRN